MAGPGKDFADFVIEQMALLGPVRAKRMFGGYGLYLDDLMFALIVNDQLYLKTDDASAEEFRRRDLAPFTYTARGKPVSVRYFEAPPEVFDDPEEMRDWAGRAWACARRAR